MSSASRQARKRAEHVAAERRANLFRVTAVDRVARVVELHNGVEAVDWEPNPDVDLDDLAVGDFCAVTGQVGVHRGVVSVWPLKGWVH